ncbi:MAG: hypothetical protein WHV44_12910 [Anaerolineales bacterium]
MGDKAWKRTERTIAARLNGQRVPITGRARGSAPDIAHPWLSIEVKHRKRLPLWLLEALDQARAAATDRQMPICILHQAGERHDNDLVLMRMSDFVAWFGSVEIEHIY